MIFLAKMLQDNRYNMSVNLLGMTKDEFKYFEHLIIENSIEDHYLKVSEHVPHTQALALLKSFDVLVLPAYLNSKYIGMPLKLLEYFAAGKIVIIANSHFYRDILPESLRVFSYIPQDIDDLYKSILRAIKYEELVDLINEGIEFAEKFTWERRTRNIIWSSK
jgi:glycosyltransferase involved in cell wall biosynthesis